MEKESNIDFITSEIEESIRVMERMKQTNLSSIHEFSQKVLSTLLSGNKLILGGNGGSAADCQHMAAEFVGRFQRERKSYPACALTSDTSIITAIANDYSWDVVFERQLDAVGVLGDLFIAITTSGESENVVRAVIKAREMGIYTVAMTGKDGGRIKDFSDLSIIVPSNSTARIQEAHGVIIHLVCELVDRKL